MKYFLNVIIGLMLAQSMLAQSNEKAFRDEIKQWDEKRIESLRSANGWVNLAGLFWLTPGENKFGAASDNQIVFNDLRFPAHLGSFILNEKEVMWKTAPGNEVYNKQQLVDQLIHFDINQNQGIQLAYQTFRWTIIKRENMVGVRFRDLDHPNLKIFHHIERYKPSLKWKINATLEQSLYASVSITNVLGQTYQMPSPGKIVFEIEGKKYKLDAVDEGGDDLFILFADDTNAEDTYESGRFLYIPKPDANGNTVVDFNKSINPPCAFSTFATCPLPPKQNVLPIAVMAGEKRVHLK
ncbi:MAG: DUF1684 domain-containing protein [Chitinophagaceae bacterium]|nr:DUF1684 domain-containing protein [Chitinophagaceae bacterium]